MQSPICNHDECAGEDGQPNDIFPQGKDIETEGAENRGTGYFDVQPVLVIDQSKVFDLVDN